MTRTATSIRYALGLLLAFGALNALGAVTTGCPARQACRWNGGSPFDDYFVPSVILFVVVGGTLGFAPAGAAA